MATTALAMVPAFHQKRISPSIAALDLRGDYCGGSVSSKSVRRKDVLRRPCDDMIGLGATVVVGPEGAADVVPSNAMVLHASEERRAVAVLHRGGDSAGSGSERRAVMVSPPPPAASASSSERRMQPHPLSEEYGSRRARRGMDPDETVGNNHRALVCGNNGRPRDPPGECPDDRPVMCLDVVVPAASTGALVGSSEISGGESVSRCGGGSNGRRSYRNVKWVDPKSVEDAEEVDYGILRHYENFRSGDAPDPPSSSSAVVVHSSSIVPYTGTAPAAAMNNNNDDIDFGVSKKELLSNPRTRIATISSGYKKANYFVREDLDTRIYFHAIEDAVGYMAKRGYVKMKRNEEREWRTLLGRAHGVVKVGPKKEKQRYRKGKLVMILKKTITNHTANTSSKNKRSSGRKSKSRSVPLLENGSTTSSQTSCTDYSNSEYSLEFSQASVHTDRTSLGKSIRQGYKSYSEKFLAEQEEEKRQCLLAIAEGRPLPESGYNNTGSNNNSNGSGGSDNKPLLLTDGSTTMCSTSRASRGGDPDADTTAGSEASSRGETTSYGSTTHLTSTVADSDFKKSSTTMGSARRGVYGGGVRYFTPDKPCSEHSEEETTEDEDFEEEDTYDDDDNEEEETEGGTYESEDQTDVVDVHANEMGSMFTEEESTTYNYNQNAGVESVTTVSTSEQNEVLNYKASSKKRSSGSGRRRGSRGLPEMAPISDGSASSSSR